MKIVPNLFHEVRDFLYLAMENRVGDFCMKYFSLERLLDDNGVVMRCPSKFGQRLQVVAYLAERFEPGCTYTELEVNDVIRSHIAFSDYVTIRRELVDFGFLMRSTDCREYRRAEELPLVESILEKF